MKAAIWIGLACMATLSACAAPAPAVVATVPGLTPVQAAYRVTLAPGERDRMYRTCLSHFRGGRQVSMAGRETYCGCSVNTLPVYVGREEWDRAMDRSYQQ